MKKLLVATSALVSTAPAFAQNVTLSGTFEMDYTTGDLTATNTAAASATGNRWNNITTLAGTPLAFNQSAYDSGLLGGGDGDINTFSVFLAWDADNFGGTFTWSSIATGSNGLDFDIDSFNIYADTQFGRFAIGTLNGRTTDEDLTETGFAADETFIGASDFAGGFNYTNAGLPFGGFGNFGVDDGPADDLPGVTNSVTNPSFQYTSPELVPGLTTRVTWGGQSGTLPTSADVATVVGAQADLVVEQSEDYMLSVAYANGGVTANLDFNGNGDYKLDARVETAFGNFLLEYGYGQDVFANIATTGAVTTTATTTGGVSVVSATNTTNDATSLTDAAFVGRVADNNNYELRYEAPSFAGVNGALYFDSDGTAAIEASYSFEVIAVGMSYTDFGDDAAIALPAINFGSGPNALTNINAIFGAGATVVPARILGGVTATELTISSDAAGIPLTLGFEQVDTGSIIAPEADVYLEANVSDNLDITVREDSVNFTVKANF